MKNIVLSAPTAEAINEEHRLAHSCAANAIEHAIRCGQLLLAKKAELKHGKFLPWVAENCEFSYESGKLYMKAWKEAEKGNALPISIRHLLPNAKPAEPQHKRYPEPPPEDGMTTDDLEVLPAERFGTVYADPPWKYGNQGTRAATGNHYPGMTVDEICALPISRLVLPNAHLHLWTTNGFLFDAKRVIEAWGFEYKSCFVWVKPQMGIGNYWRVAHEFLLLGVRGSATFTDKGLISWAQIPRCKHSDKPEEVRDFIERASPGQYLELFARRAAPGWTCWGNEIRRELFVA